MNAHRLAGRDAELLAHQVHAVDQLGDRMLDLDAGVHLEEIERAVGREQKLAGPRAAICHRLGRGDRGGAHPLAELGVHGRRRRLLDQLLVPPLDRALALAEVDGARVVGQDLDLHVPRPLDVLLEIDARVAEGLERLTGRALERAGELLRRPHHPHALAPAAGRRLDHHRITHLAGQTERGAELVNGALEPGTIGTPAACMRRRASVLSPMARMAPRRRPDPGEPRALDGLGERWRAPPGTRSPDARRRHPTTARLRRDG